MLDIVMLDIVMLDIVMLSVAAYKNERKNFLKSF
jgi:hypothetical protein